MNYAANCWPTSQQLLLLQAALCEEPVAILAWKMYCRQVDLQHIDPVSATFLPLIADRFQGENFPELMVCKSAYRHAWAQNSMAFFHLRKILAAFERAGIQACVLKGIAMIAAYYQNPALRMMGDIDILVPPTQVKAAIKILQELQFELTTPASEVDIFLRDKKEILLRKDDCFIDLHWMILTDSNFNQKLKNWPYRTQKIFFEKCQVELTVLAPEDQLIHTIHHGLRYSEASLIRWIPDVTLILQRTPNFDWTYFVSQLRYLELEWLMKIMFTYLETHHFVSFPGFVKQALVSYAPSPEQIKRFELATQSHTRGYFIRRFWDLHQQNSGSRNILFLLVTLPFFLRKGCGCRTWIHSLGFIFKKLRGRKS